MAGSGQGGGFSNAGKLSFTSITLNMTDNTATGANGANGGSGGIGTGSKAGTGKIGATGGAGIGGNGGRAGGGGDSGGGGGFNDHNGILVIAPRQARNAAVGSPKRSTRSRRTCPTAVKRAGGCADQPAGPRASGGQSGTVRRRASRAPST